MSMTGRWLEEHGSELHALIAKIGKETGRLVQVEGVACDMLDQALEVFLQRREKKSLLKKSSNRAVF